MIDPQKVLFSKHIDRGEDSVSIHIECEEDLNVSISVPHSVVLYEAMNGGVPVVVATFADGAGDLVNIRNLDTTLRYIMHIGTTQGRLISNVPLKIASIEFGNTVSGQMKHLSYEVTFVHETWDGFSYGSHSRGWSGARWSDVVSDMTSYFSDRSITPTRGVESSVIQPNWTNVKMLRWIAQRSISSSGDTNYVYGISVDGRFFFSPFSSLYDNLNNDLVVSANTLMYVSREKTHTLNKQGASGVYSDSYDFMTGAHSRETITYDDVPSSSISDWTLVDSSLAPHIEINHGRDPHHRNISMNRVAKLVDAYQSVKVMSTAAAAIGVRIGESMDLTLMSFDDLETNAAFSENYSGRYVVTASKVAMTETRRGRPTLQVELTLSRQGINDSERRNYMRGH